MMKDYYQKSMRALQLAGMSERTQSAGGGLHQIHQDACRFF
jgi:hypothetical protein